MKLRNIAQKNGKAINLQIMKDNKRLVLANQEFEVSDEIGKDLLKQTIEDKAIVEKVKEEKVNKEV